MSSPRGIYLRVGLLLTGTAALLVGAILLLTGDRWHQGHRYETYFKESVQGLEVGAPVKYRGVTLGNVTGIGLVSAEYGDAGDPQISDMIFRLVVVHFKVDPRKVGHLPGTIAAVASGLRAKLANQGLTGLMYLELDFVNPDKYPFETVPWLPRDDYLPSVPSTFAQLQDQVVGLLQKFSTLDLAGLLDHVDGLVGDLRGSLGGQGDVHATLAATQELIAALRAQIDGADLAGLSAAFRQSAGSVTALAQGEATRRVIANANAALQRLPPLLESLQATASRAGDGTADLVAQLTPLLADARATLANLREASEAIRRDPGQVLLQGPPPREKP